MAHLLRARPRPHPARQRVPPPGRQDPGVRVPRRPPAHPAHPRPRGRPGRHVRRPGARAQRRAHRGDRPRPRLRPRPGRPRQRGRPVAVRRRRLRPRRVGRRRHADAAEPVRRDARRHPQPLVVPAGADDAGGRGRSAGPTASPTSATTSRTPSPPASSRPTSCPPIVRGRCGERRSQQLGAFITAMIDAAGRDRADRHDRRRGRGARPRSAGSTTSSVYLRPASQAQADAVIDAAAGPRRALRRAPAAAARRRRRRCRQRRGAARRGHLRRRHDRPLRLPQAALRELGWDPARLPQGIDTHLDERVDLARRLAALHGGR